MSSTPAKHAFAATLNSNRDNRQRWRNSPIPISLATETPTMAPMAGRDVGQQIGSGDQQQQRPGGHHTSSGNWVREPAWSIAAAREVEEPMVKPDDRPEAGCHARRPGHRLGEVG